MSEQQEEAGLHTPLLVSDSLETELLVEMADSIHPVDEDNSKKSGRLPPYAKEAHVRGGGRAHDLHGGKEDEALPISLREDVERCFELSEEYAVARADNFFTAAWTDDYFEHAAVRRPPEGGLDAPPPALCSSHSEVGRVGDNFDFHKWVLLLDWCLLVAASLVKVIGPFSTGVYALASALTANTDALYSSGANALSTAVAVTASLLLILFLCGRKLFRRYDIVGAFALIAIFPALVINTLGKVEYTYQLTFSDEAGLDVRPIVACGILAVATIAAFAYVARGVPRDGSGPYQFLLTSPKHRYYYPISLLMKGLFILSLHAYTLTWTTDDYGLYRAYISSWVTWRASLPQWALAVTVPWLFICCFWRPFQSRLHTLLLSRTTVGLTALFAVQLASPSLKGILSVVYGGKGSFPYLTDEGVSRMEHSSSFIAVVTVQIVIILGVALDGVIFSFKSRRGKQLKLKSAAATPAHPAGSQAASVVRLWDVEQELAARVWRAAWKSLLLTQCGPAVKARFKQLAAEYSAQPQRAIACHWQGAADLETAQLRQHVAHALSRTDVFYDGSMDEGENSASCFGRVEVSLFPFCAKYVACNTNGTGIAYLRETEQLLELLQAQRRPEVQERTQLRRALRALSGSSVTLPRLYSQSVSETFSDGEKRRRMTSVVETDRAVVLLDGGQDAFRPVLRFTASVDVELPDSGEMVSMSATWEQSGAAIGVTADFALTEELDWLRNKTDDVADALRSMQQRELAAVEQAEATQAADDAVLSPAVLYFVVENHKAPRRLVQRCLRGERAAAVRALADRTRELDFLYARMRFLRRHPCVALWWLFWSDVWEENSGRAEVMAQEEALDPWKVTALPYRPAVDVEDEHSQLVGRPLVDALLSRLHELNAAWLRAERVV